MCICMATDHVVYRKTTNTKLKTEFHRNLIPCMATDHVVYRKRTNTKLKTEFHRNLIPERRNDLRVMNVTTC